MIRTSRTMLGYLYLEGHGDLVSYTSNPLLAVE